MCEFRPITIEEIMADSEAPEEITQKYFRYTPTCQSEALNKITQERERQNIKWGFPQFNNFAEWAAILAEEFGELSKELNEAHFREPNKERIVTEAIHVAAVAVSIIEHYDITDNRVQTLLKAHEQI